MPAVYIGIPRRRDGGKKMIYTTGDGKTGSMHRTSSQFEFSHTYGVETMDRAGMKAITRHSSPGLRTLKFSQILFHRDYTQSIEPLVAQVVNIGARGTRIRFTNGSPYFENGRWWMINSINVKAAGRALDNSVSRVVLEWDLIEYVPVPYPGSAARRPVQSPKARTTPRASGGTRSYRVVRGDTLWLIAGRLLGNSYRWREIYNLNSAIIRNPHVLVPGTTLRIPGR